MIQTIKVNSFEEFMDAVNLSLDTVNLAGGWYIKKVDFDNERMELKVYYKMKERESLLEKIKRAI